MKTKLEAATAIFLIGGIISVGVALTKLGDDFFASKLKPTAYYLKLGIGMPMIFLLPAAILAIIAIAKNK